MNPFTSAKGTKALNMVVRVLVSTSILLLILPLVGCKTVDAVNEDLQTAFKSSDDSAADDHARLVRDAQRLLKQKGYDPGPIDGIEGPSTRAALNAFQSDNGLPVSRGVNEAVVRQLKSTASLSTPPRQERESRVTDAKPVTAEPSDPVTSRDAPPEKAAVPTYVVVSANTELLSSADPFADVVAKLRRGTRVLVLSRDGEWLHVESDGKKGYLYADLAR